MIYKNSKTGAVINSPCNISGGDWELQESEIKEESVKETETKEEPVEKPKKTRTKKEEK